MRKRRGPSVRVVTVVVVAAVAAMTSGCRTFTDNEVVARVGDDELTASAFDDAASDAAREDAGAARSEVGEWIVSRVVSEELAANDIPIDEAAREQARAALTGEETDAQREFLVERQAVIGTWIENPTAAEMEPFRGRYEQGSQASGVACLSIIAAPSQADAESALGELDGTPEGFAELARASSADESGQNGGSIGCQPLSQLSSAPDLAEAVVTTEIGSVAGPLQLGEQFYLIYIQPFEVARSGLGGVFAGERFSALAADAEVYVDPRYGRFDPEAVGVEPLGPRDTGLVAPPGE